MIDRGSVIDRDGPGFYPTPSTRLRLAGAAGVAGALTWPLALIVLAVAAGNCVPGACTIDRGSLAIAAIAPVLFAVAVAGLELRAPRPPGFGDLVGDLTIGTSAALFVISLLVGTVSLAGPGLLLLLIGSLIFGAVGYLGAGRHRMASALVALGAGSLLVFLFGGAVSGDLGTLGAPSLIGLLLFCAGWAWLGADLLLARPLAIPEKR